MNNTYTTLCDMENKTTDTVLSHDLNAAVSRSDSSMDLLIASLTEMAKRKTIKWSVLIDAEDPENTSHEFHATAIVGSHVVSVDFVPGAVAEWSVDVRIPVEDGYSKHCRVVYKAANEEDGDNPVTILIGHIYGQL